MIFLYATTDFENFCKTGLNYILKILKLQETKPVLLYKQPIKQVIADYKAFLTNFKKS